MQLLSTAPVRAFRSVRFILTDMDETLTYRGRLAAATYTALEQLQAIGIKVIPVTAAPAGWCDQMARMWPVDGVIGENGGLFFRRSVDGRKRLSLAVSRCRFFQRMMGAVQIDGASQPCRMQGAEPIPIAHTRKNSSSR